MCAVTQAEFLSLPLFLLLGISSEVPRLCEWCCSRAITAGVPQLALRQSQQREQTHRCFMVLTDFGHFSLLFLQMRIFSYMWSLYMRMWVNVCVLEVQKLWGKAKLSSVFWLQNYLWFCKDLHIPFCVLRVIICAEYFCTVERRDFPLKKPFSYTSEHSAFRKSTA